MAQEIKKKLKIKINSEERLEGLLQELYSEACKQIEQVQNEMNRLSNSVQLNDEIVEAKAKYAKAMNDFINTKDRAIGRKLEIAKLLSDIIKNQGNVKKALNENEGVHDWASMMDEFDSKPATDQKEQVQQYIIKE